MLDKLRHPLARRVFITFCFVGAVAAALSNYWLNRTVIQEFQAQCGPGAPAAAEIKATGPSTPIECIGWRAFVAEVGPGVTVEFLSAFLIAASLVALLSFLKSEEDSVDDIRQLFRPSQRKSHLEALDKSDFWIHDGHMASWVRRYVLPKFADDSRRTLSIRRIQVAVIDPMNMPACHAFLDHIKSLEDDEQRIRSIADLRLEVCCLVVEFARNVSSAHLELDIYLKNDMDLMRRDITALRAFITTPGKDKPAIVLENRPTSVYYHLHLRNFRIRSHRFNRIDLAAVAAEGIASGHSSGRARIRAMLMTAFGADASEFCDDDFCDQVRERCRIGHSRADFGFS